MLVADYRSTFKSERLASLEYSLPEKDSLQARQIYSLRSTGEKQLASFSFGSLDPFLSGLSWDRASPVSSAECSVAELFLVGHLPLGVFLFLSLGLGFEIETPALLPNCNSNNSGLLSITHSMHLVNEPSPMNTRLNLGQHFTWNDVTLLKHSQPISTLSRFGILLNTKPCNESVSQPSPMMSMRTSWQRESR